MKLEEVLDEELFLWEMSNLTKTMTGLPMNIYISTSASVHDRHGPRIKVQASASNKIIPTELTSVLFGGAFPVDVSGKLSSDDFAQVSSFILNNRELLTLFWNNEINIAQFLERMIKN